jgi:hypothetical protein
VATNSCLCSARKEHRVAVFPAQEAAGGWLATTHVGAEALCHYALNRPMNSPSTARLTRCSGRSCAACGCTDHSEQKRSDPACSARTACSRSRQAGGMQATHSHAQRPFARSAITQRPGQLFFLTTILKIIVMTLVLVRVSILSFVKQLFS